MESLFDTGTLLPHGQCLTWDPDLLALHAASDGLIALSYLAIPGAILYFVRHRKDLEGESLRLAALFIAFIVACALTHLSGLLTLWLPVYWIEGVLKAITAAVSLTTAFVLIPLLPRLIALPSARDLRVANQRLQEEVVARNKAVADLEAIRTDLERRVEQRAREVVRIMDNFETTLRGSSVTVFQQDVDLRYTWIHNTRAPYTSTDYIGRRDVDVLPAETAALVIPAKEEAMRTGEKVHVEVPVHRNNVTVWYDLTCKPLYNEDGVAGLAAVAVDITPQKESERQLRVVMRELTHRSKNLLAVVQGIARQTAAQHTSLEGFVERFSARLHGLAGSHDLLVSTDWRGARFPELIKAHVGHLLQGDANQLVMDGPDVMLSPQATQQIGMAMHELGTNAAKYGALSGPDGRVEIRWTREAVFKDDAAGTPVNRITLVWQEVGGPPVSPPTSSGFGHVMTDTLVPRALRGTAETRYAPEGVTWTLSFDMEREEGE